MKQAISLFKSEPSQVPYHKFCDTRDPVMTIEEFEKNLLVIFKNFPELIRLFIDAEIAFRKRDFDTANSKLIAARCNFEQKLAPANLARFQEHLQFNFKKILDERINNIHPVIVAQHIEGQQCRRG